MSIDWTITASIIQTSDTKLGWNLTPAYHVRLHLGMAGLIFGGTLPIPRQPRARLTPHWMMGRAVLRRRTIARNLHAGEPSERVRQQARAP